jgi:hypothetical protein
MKPPRFRHPKKQGEWAELAFMTRAAGLGLTVAKPMGESARFDVVVIGKKKMWRVQVKSVSVRRPRGRIYMVNMAAGMRRAYLPHEIDLLAVYIIPEGAWYLIPIEAVTALAAVYLGPCKKARKQDFEGYREAWDVFR